MLKRIFLATIAFISLILLTPGQSDALEPDWSDYAALLQEHVSHGEKNGVKLNLVDYQAWGGDKRWPVLLYRLAAFDEQLLVTQEEKRAFWINAYNILAIRMVLEHLPVDSIRDAGNLFSPVWKKPAGIVAGKKRTLHEIEHEILRPMGEPRIHAAIVCASVSCPDLRVEPYLAALLNRQLHDQMSRFLAEPHKGLAVHANDLTVSKIFDWFEADFKASGGVLALFHRYRPELPRQVRITGFLAYDWSLNSRSQ